MYISKIGLIKPTEACRVHLLHFILALFSFIEKFCDISKAKKSNYIHFSALFILMSAFIMEPQETIMRMNKDFRIRV